jgi:hypothetical protein
MRKARVALILAAVGLWLACSDSGGPAPTFAGTWHVTIGPVGTGNLSPTSLDVVVTAAGNDSFHVTIPAMTWSIGPVVYDGAPTIPPFSDTTYWGFSVAPSNPTQRCDDVLFIGQKNAGKDTLTSAVVQVFHSDTVAGGYCTAQAEGSITAHK